MTASESNDGCVDINSIPAVVKFAIAYTLAINGGMSYLRPNEENSEEVQIDNTQIQDYTCYPKQKVPFKQLESLAVALIIGVSKPSTDSSLPVQVPLLPPPEKQFLEALSTSNSSQGDDVSLPSETSPSRGVSLPPTSSSSAVTTSVQLPNHSHIRLEDCQCCMELIRAIVKAHEMPWRLIPIEASRPYLGVDVNFDPKDPRMSRVMASQFGVSQHLCFKK